ncbi:putative late blight resistance protein homolog R1A-10 [Sesamum indicum]|uniref:Late blight resistance protein homolog R1A-10 n=1 Tax=Sesamum indicum TaxID=4182 RepID=A0A6I9SRX5_SESIN|nr:putative late blight resistance protein homolog R1A-10 [Sesamum indicum]
MAYAAVVSLVQILEPLKSDQFLIKSLHDNFSSLQSSLERIYPVPRRSKDHADQLEIDIRDAAYEAQDLIESWKIRSSESEEIPLQDLQELISKLDRIADSAKGVVDSIGHRTDQDHQKGELLSEEALSTKSTYSSKSGRIVGQEKDFQKIKDLLLGGKEQLQVVPITGLPGIGKTTLARSLYDDEDMEQKKIFQVRSWVTVSQESRPGDILSNLLSSIEIVGQRRDATDSIKKMGDRANEDSAAQLGVNLHQRLFNVKYFIVIDDMWENKVWNEVRNYLPDNKNGSRILLTTRSAEVAKYVNDKIQHQMEPLNEKDSWILLCDKAFEDGICPPHLEEVGKEISKHCDGLPLSLTVVGGLLSQKRKKVEDWEFVKEDIYAAVENADRKENRYLEILSLSYNHLPGRLRGCFLYMGAFPEDSEILASKLIKLWVTEGFLTTPASGSLERVARHSLNELIDRNLISRRRVTSDSQIKTCGVHDSLRALAVEESRKQKFFFSRYRYVQDLPEGSDRLRRLSVHKNILMCLENVYNSTKSIKSARTLLYAGPHHHHPFPFPLTFDLLRVLDALTLYFIEFPKEVVALIHLRYLSLTYNGKIPSSISKLRNLQVLIVRQHPKIIFLGASILPVEIWNMPQLRHLLFTESNLPSLPGLEIDANDSVLLKNLQSLSDVHAACCIKNVLRHVPNLTKLGTWVEEPSDVHLCLNQLEKLESFKFIVLNPIPNPENNFLPKLVFPKTLTKLTLSGCGLHWEDMAIIEELPNLEVLKLREFAFQGPKWDLEEMFFPELKFLLLEALQLQIWTASDDNFPSLERLIIRHCYELEKIPPEIAEIGPLRLIQLVDCSPTAVASAQEIKKDKQRTKKDLEVRIHSSWA